MRLSFVLSIILYCLCTWLTWTDLNSARAEPNTPLESSGFYHYLSSDALYGPALFRDFFLEKVETRGWTLPPAPYFFPDLLVYFVILAFLKQPLAAFVAGKILFTLSLLSAGFFLRTAFEKQKHIYSSVLLAGSLLLIMIVTDVLPASFHGLIVPTFHHGSSACAFLAYALMLRGLFKTRPIPGLVGLFALSWAAMLSDSVYAALVVPGAFLYLGLTDAERSRKIWTAISLGAGLFAGRSSVRWINGLGNFQIVTIAPEKDVLSGLANWSRVYLQDFLQPWYLLAIGVSILGLLLALRYKKAPDRLALLLPSLGILSILFAANVFGPQVGIGKMQDRYVLFAVFATIVLLAFQFLKSSIFRRGGIVALIVIALVLLSKVGEAKEHPLFVNTRCLKALSQELSLTYGVADYWYAKPYTILSEREVRLNEVDLTLGPRPWINNIDRFVTETSVPSYDYLIANNLPPEMIRDRIGPPTVIRNCGHLSVWIYDKNENPRLANLYSLAQMQVWRQAIGR